MYSSDLIDVILPIYKESIELIKTSILSILNQENVNIHLIIVLDNFENVQAKEFVFSIMNFKKYDITFLINDKNLGLISSLNKALNHLKGEFVARMDADDISKKNRLNEQKNYLQINNLDFIGSSAFLINNKKIIGSVKVPDDCSDIKKFHRYTNSFVHSSFFFRRSIVDSDFFYPSEAIYCEDYALTCRLLLSGYKLGNCPQKLIYYRKNNEGVSVSHKFEQRYMFQIISRLYRKKIIPNDKSILNFEKSNTGKKLFSISKKAEIFYSQYGEIRNRNKMKYFCLYFLKCRQYAYINFLSKVKLFFYKRL